MVRVAAESRHATYDCEFVVLARLQRVKLVTSDKDMIKKFPDVVVSLEDFAAGK